MANATDVVKKLNKNIIIISPHFSNFIIIICTRKSNIYIFFYSFKYLFSYCLLVLNKNAAY